MEQEQFTIRLGNVSEADANQYATELKRLLADVSPDVTVNQMRDDPQSQDLGATLVLVLGSGAIVAIANGIADWLRKRKQVTMTIKNERTQVSVDGVSGADAVRIAQIFEKASRLEN